MTIGLIGSGSWGTAIAKILTENGHDVIWCVRSEKMVDHILARHHNPKYLSSIYFDLDRLKLTTDPSVVYQGSNMIVYAMPSAFAESYIDPYKDLLKDKVIVSAIKGILPSQQVLMNEYLQMQLGCNENNYVTLMGPCHAEEVAAEKLSYLTFSSVDIALAEKISTYFKTPFINTVVNTDVFGVQYASVLKNIYALGAGIAHGLGYGDNFQSVFVANAAGEIKRFLGAVKTIQKQGIEVDSTVDYDSSVYLGDLLVTCYSLFSRNRSFGNMIGKGYGVEATKLAMQMVAEGYPASKSMHQLNQKINASMPMATSIYEILWEGKNPVDAFQQIEKRLF
jgi:glycerol-3-phosphate dehydrogenase (NAD(P)+)